MPLTTPAAYKLLLTDIICWLFIALWMYAAASKLFDHESFQTQLGQSPLLTPFAVFVSWFIPVIEIILSVLLFSERMRLIGLYGSFVLMSLFTAYIFAITRFSDHIPCSCGGILEKMSWNQHLVFNLFFVVLAATGVLMHHKSYLLQQSRGS